MVEVIEPGDDFIEWRVAENESRALPPQRVGNLAGIHRGDRNVGGGSCAGEINHRALTSNERGSRAGGACVRWKRGEAVALLEFHGALSHEHFNRRVLEAYIEGGADGAN